MDRLARNSLAREIMSTLEELARVETANSGLAFRERAYGSVERQCLLRDVIGMANATVHGPRVMFMGVRDKVGGERVFVGVPGEAVAYAAQAYQLLVTRFVEPPFVLRIRAVEVERVTVAALIVEQCDDPPYLLKASLSNTMRMGNGWIRRGTQTMRLTRTDLQRMFEAKFRDVSGSADVQVGFPGTVPQPEITLPVLELDELPSEMAGERIREMLKAKRTSREIFGRTLTRIERLVHAKLFGGDRPYEQHSSSSLLRRLEGAALEHEAADRHYELEARAHKLNVSLCNVGGADLQSAALVLDFPRLEGFGVVESPCRASGEPEIQEGYPVVDPGPRATRVQAAIVRVPRGNSVNAFAVPLRVWCRQAAAGKTLPVDFTLHGKGLREPASGTLRVHVCGADAVV